MVKNLNIKNYTPQYLANMYFNIMSRFSVCALKVSCYKIQMFLLSVPHTE